MQDDDKRDGDRLTLIVGSVVLGLMAAVLLAMPFYLAWRY